MTVAEPPASGAAASAASRVVPGGQSRGRLLLGGTAAWAAAVAYVAWRLDRHWVADDEGLIGQSAERVLRGELPHLDFADVYTGGWSFLHALAFDLAGVSLLTPRYTVLLFFALWLPAVLYIALRFVPPAAAVLTMLLAAVWSLPNYPAAMPSWYNLFLATFGVAALLRFGETGRVGWLFLAGFVGGLSFLIKVSGLFFVAAALLYLTARSARPELESPSKRRFWPYEALLGLALVGFVLGLVRMVAPVISPAHVYHFVLPGLVLATVALLEVVRSGGGGQRLRRLLRETAVLTGGAAVPVLVFAAPYARASALDTLAHGIFIAPTTRFAYAALAPVTLWLTVPAALLGAVTLLSGAKASRLRWSAVAALLLLLGAMSILGGGVWLYQMLWAGLAQSTPLMVLAGGLVLVRRRRTAGVASGSWEQTYLVLAAAGLCSLIQFAYAGPVYFCYTAPLTFLAAAAIWRTTGQRPNPALALLSAAYLLFAVVWMNGRALAGLGHAPVPHERLVSLSLPRAGLLIPGSDAEVYQTAVEVLRRHARGSFTYAAPDAPEIYFLSGLRNPTRRLFEFTETGATDPAHMLARLRELGVTGIVINRYPKFSQPLSHDWLAVLATAYPQEAVVGKFTVRWSE